MPETYTGTISIDGKGTFRYVLTPVNAAGVVAIPPAEGTQPVRTTKGEVVSVILVKHEMKTGIIGEGKKRAGETWVKHSFRGSDNRRYDSFEDKVVSQLSPAVGTGAPVKFIAKANDFKGFDVIEVLGT